jgi:MFS family permease
MLLPLILALTIVAPLTGVFVTIIGYYTPFMIASAIFLCIGAGLLTTFTPQTQHPAWIGYQILFGIGIGLGIQQSPVIIQVVLPPDDVPIATAMVLFMQTLGGAIFIAVSQSIFQTQLIALLKQNVPQVDPYAILNIGATEITTLLNGQSLANVRADYNKSLTTSWYPAVGMGALALIGAAVVERRSVKEALPMLTTILSREKGSGSLWTRVRNMGR